MLFRSPTHTLQSALTQTTVSASAGDTRVLWIGEPAAIPIAASELSPGIGYAVADLGGSPTRSDLFLGAIPSRNDALTSHIRQAIVALRNGDTNRFGRLLAPFAIHYVMVPLADGMVGTLDHPLVAPIGLAEMLDRQLDLAAPLSRPQQYLVYENRAASGVTAQLSLAGAAGSHQAGAAAIAQVDLAGSTPVTGSTFTVSPGTVHLAVPFNNGWRLRVGATDVAPRRAFGSTVAFDTNAAGQATLHFTRPLSRLVWIAIQLGCWLLALAIAADLRIRRRRDGWVYDPTVWADPTSPLIDLSLPEYRE